MQTLDYQYCYPSQRDNGEKNEDRVRTFFDPARANPLAATPSQRQCLISCYQALDDFCEQFHCMSGSHYISQ